MDKFKQELIEGIVEVSERTEMTADECIRQAIELLEKEKSKSKDEQFTIVIPGELPDLNTIIEKSKRHWAEYSTLKKIIQS